MSLLLCAEAIIAIIAVLAIVPLTDKIFNQSSHDESTVTSLVSTALNEFGIDDTVAIFATLFLFANLLKAIIDTMLRYCTLNIKYNVYKHYVLYTLSNVMQSNWSFFSNTNRGKIINSLQQELTNVANTMAQMASQISHVVQLVIYCTIPLYLSPQVTFVALVFAVLVCVPFLLANKIGYKLGQENTSTANNMVSVFVETISSMRLILSFSSEKVELERNRNSIEKHVRASINSQTFVAAVGYLFQPLALIAVMLSAGTALSKGAEISSIAGVLWALLRALVVLGKLVQTNVNIHNFIPSYEQIENLNNEALRAGNIATCFNEPTFKKSIKVHELTFSYGVTKPEIKNFSMTINQHAITGLVGPSGSGKSTIVDLILGLQPAGSGYIKVDGKELKKLDFEKISGANWLRSARCTSFNMTIADNIRWARQTASDADIVNALPEVQCHGLCKKTSKWNSHNCRRSGGKIVRRAKTTNYSSKSSGSKSQLPDIRRGY